MSLLELSPHELLSMVSVPNPTLKFDTFGERPEPSISPVSPKSWGDTISELTKGLQRICGRSPSNSGNSSPFLRLGGCHGGGTTPTSSCSLRASPDVTPNLSPVKTPRPRPEVPRRTAWMRLDSHPPTAGVSGRPLMVRHEETNEKLHEKLSKICRPRTSGVSASDGASGLPAARQVMELSRSSFRRESLKAGFRHHVPVNPVDVNCLAVAVYRIHGQDHILRVLLFQGKCPRIVEELQLPAATRVEHILCCYVDGKLIIRERSRPALSLEGRDPCCQFLPVIQDDEAFSELRVVLHIPACFRFEDLVVRTVDDSLVISGRRKRMCDLRPHSCGDYPALQCDPLAEEVQDGEDVFCAQPEPTIRLSDPQFSMAVELGERVDSRSVSATLTNSNQLVIVAQFGPNSRRYTC